MMRSNMALGRMLILAPVSSRDLVKDISPISLVIMGALGSLFLIDNAFIMMELTVSLSWILLGFLWRVHISLRNFALEGNGYGHLLKGV